MDQLSLKSEIARLERMSLVARVMFDHFVEENRVGMRLSAEYQQALHDIIMAGVPASPFMLEERRQCFEQVASSFENYVNSHVFLDIVCSAIKDARLFLM